MRIMLYALPYSRIRESHQALKHITFKFIALQRDSGLWAVKVTTVFSRTAGITVIFRVIFARKTFQITLSKVVKTNCKN